MAASRPIRPAEPARLHAPEFLCPNCRHRFAPESPDPCTCPECGALCSRREGMHFVEVDLEPGVPPPMPPTPDERRRYQWVFWIVFISTPFAVFLMTAMQRTVHGWMSPPLRNLLAWIVEGPLPGLAALAAGCLTAGVCLTRLRRPRLAGTDLVLNALSWAVLVILAHLVLIIIGGTVVLSVISLLRR